MRPVIRGASPRNANFSHYRDAFAPLVGRIGLYCSYCERYLKAGIAVEHIQPKGFKLPNKSEPYRHLEGTWTNFLLGCINCNSTKGDQDVDLTTLLLPDRDNTFLAFTYTADGKVTPASGGPAGAAELVRLTGISKNIRQTYDDNGILIALDRSSQRMEAWDLAVRYRTAWQGQPTQVLQNAIVDLALREGFFSIWMAVFANEPEMRQEFIRAFKAAPDCFDPVTTAPITPRPTDPVTGLVDGLAHGGKI